MDHSSKGSTNLFVEIAYAELNYHRSRLFRRNHDQCNSDWQHAGESPLLLLVRNG